MESTGFIYRIVSADEPDRVRYVGQTSKTVAIRSRGHWYDARRGKDYPVCRWLKKRAVEDAVEFQVVEEVPISRLDEREIFWIAHYRTLGQADLNISQGGGGFRGRVFSEEERQAKRERMLGLFAGEKHGAHKLTWDEVREIREIRTERWVSEADLGAEYGVSQSVIHKILKNASWKDESFDPSKVQNRPAETHANNRQVPEAVVREIRDLRMREWVPEAEIARRYGITRSNVNNILRNHRWPDPNYNPENRVRAGGDGTGSKLTEEQVLEIKDLLAEGRLKQREIGDIYGVSQTQVSRISRGVRWKDVA